MKYLLTFSLLFSTALSFAQETINGSIVVDSVTRTYKLYVPASYTPGTAVPLVLNFHGKDGNSNQQMIFCDFRPMADTADFLVVHPQGTRNNLNQLHWNVGEGMSTVDDVHFIDLLLDSLSAKYSIDSTRIYSAGFSNGGAFSMKLACELGSRIAAIASVGGAFVYQQDTACHPQRPISTMIIHGTSDVVVPYNGNSTFSSVQTVLDFWTFHNATYPTPIITSVPDINSTDNSTIELYVWPDGTDWVEVQHYKITGGGHTWPGSTGFGFGNINLDIDASEKIWQFFSRFDLDGATTGIHENLQNTSIEIFPNPMNSEATIHLDSRYSNIQFNLINCLGQLVEFQTIYDSDRIRIDRNDLPAGLYCVIISLDQVSVARKILIVD